MSDRIDNAQSVVSAMREMDGNAVFNGWIDTLAEALVYAEEAEKALDELDDVNCVDCPLGSWEACDDICRSKGTLIDTIVDWRDRAEKAEGDRDEARISREHWEARAVEAEKESHALRHWLQWKFGDMGMDNSYMKDIANWEPRIDELENELIKVKRDRNIWRDLAAGMTDSTLELQKSFFQKRREAENE